MLPGSETLDHGGSGSAWPDSVETNAALSAAEALRSKGYHIVQAPAATDGHEALALLGGRETSFGRPKRELEAAYLGNDANSKLAWLDWDDHAWARGSKLIWEVGNELAPWTEEVLGFRTSPNMGPLMLRVPLESAQEKQLLDPGPLEDTDFRGGIIAEFIDFVKRRRLCIMYIGDACSDGGSIELKPRRKGSGLKQLTISIGKNELLIFRDDLLSYRYKPGATDVVIQSWLMEEGKPVSSLRKVDGSEQAFIERMGLVGPKAPKGEQTHIMAYALTAPGSSSDRIEFTTMLTSLTDGVTDLMATSRFDHAPYYSADINDGLSCARHAGFMDDEQVYYFDNAYFNIPEEDVLPKHGGTTRMFLENIATLLHEVGIPRTGPHDDIMTVLTDDRLMTDYMQLGGGHQTASSKVQRFLGLTGPNVTLDTACSSSMVAVSTAQSAFRNNGWAVNYGSMERSVTSAVAGGATNLEDPGGFVGLSQGRMIGETGRCMTFDIGANGYCRAESCTVVFMKYGDVDSASTKDRLLCITGTNTNQDGRSASLTAPNGPSQGECIKAALRESGRVPAEITFTELHGTGTALGDPIEVGSMKMVQQSRPMDQPLYHGAMKSLFGHPENNAGCTHICKMIAQHLHGILMANQHLRQMNPNAEVRAALFPTEICDVGLDVATSGASSFGFGGTNCRVDMWSYVQVGSHAVDRQPYLVGQHDSGDSYEDWCELGRKRLW